MLASLIAPMLARRGIHYGWVMVVLTFLTTISTSAAVGMAGVIITPLRTEFGWSAADVSGPLALALLLFGALAPFAAALIARHGIVRIVTVAAVLIVAGILLSTQISARWHLWVTWGLMLGIAAGMTALVLGATVANRWFTARRGLVLGILTAANATGLLIFLPLAGWLAEHYGWRYALLPPAAGCLLAIGLTVLFAADHPADLGVAPFGEKNIVPRPARAASGAVRLSLAALSQASGSRSFWVLFGTFFICGMSTNGLIGTHFVPLCLDMGMTATVAASVLGVMGTFNFIGTIASGWLSDRYDNRWLLFWYYALRGLSLAFLPLAEFSLYGLSLFALFYGLDWIATVPPTVKLVMQSYGPEQAALVFGWIFAAHQAGAAVAAYGAGELYDAIGSYLPSFTLGGLLCIVAAIGVLGIRPAPAK